MDTPTLLDALRRLLDGVPEIMEIREGIHHPRVKSWRSRLEEILRDGGKACQKSLVSMRRMGLETLSMEDTFVNRQTYISQLEAIERILKQTIQTIEVFGRPEDKDILPHWGKPKSQKRAKGYLKIGDEEVNPQSITLGEIMNCFVAYVKDSNDLTKEMRADILYHLQQIADNDLYHPFLHNKLDEMLAHWA